MNQYKESALNLIRRMGYHDALAYAARLRDQSSWGTFTHAEWNATIKEMRRLHESGEA